MCVLLIPEFSLFIKQSQQIQNLLKYHSNKGEP